MRTLTTNEVHTVAGADYSSDIVAVAATLYVGSSITGFVSSTTYAAGTALAGLVSGVAPLGWAVGTLTTVAAPALGLAAPIVIGMKMLEANPELGTAFVDKYHSYFG